jgi:hypothetical protein
MDRLIRMGRIVSFLRQMQAAGEGSVWSENMISLHQDFDVTFQVFLGYNDYGADGIAFVLQPVGTGITGGIGGGLGYFGISPSIAVEYDTYQNDDPALDHISIQLNGDVNLSGTLAGPVQASASVVNIEDGMWHSTRIVWNAGTKTMTVFFDDTFRLDYQDDIVANIFGGNSDVYWGFTGATGGAANLQQFCITSLSFGEASAIPLSPWMILVVITMIVAVTLIRYKKSI